MIVLALVASGSTILSETHDEAHARFLTAAETVLTRIPPNATRLSYSYENWLFHYVQEDGIVYLCTADGEMGRRLPFAFLSEVQKKFTSTFDATLLEDPQPADFASFTSTLSSTLNRFNTQPQSDPVKAAQAELAGVKDIMTQNVEQILNRGERLDLLMNRTDQAANQSMAFRRRAVGLRRQMWYKNAKVAGMAVFCVVVSAQSCLH
ncbi:snare-like protein [Meira miltonrushii]|uniref:Synaptobrevin homolog YKT6 n=1 Tax=Meira miltonrushii TaxID=1280837 RepID=A0A316VBW1_9BASI|nr:snare-like protein [Meira miltonrushii]PWN34960.1 snare-like protein [Meira miltonrushii]